MARPSITAIVLTRDEGLHIDRCLRSLAPVAERLCVVDSGSTDDTLARARALGAEVFEHEWINQAAQFNWALEHCDVRTRWVLRLDADEYLEPDLQRALVERLPDLPEAVHGVLLRRKYLFMGRWIRFGGMYPLWHLRLWRTGSARIEDRWMDEHAVLTSGESVRLEGDFVDHNLRDIAWWSQKHVQYATREAVQVLLEAMDAGPDGQGAPSGNASAGARRWVKNHLYNRLPLGVGPVLLIPYRLFLRLGILDGPRGIAFHLLQGFWYRLLVDLRRDELGRALARNPAEDPVATLESLTGLPLRGFRDQRPPAERP